VERVKIKSNIFVDNKYYLFKIIMILKSVSRYDLIHISILLVDIVIMQKY